MLIYPNGIILELQPGPERLVAFFQTLESASLFMLQSPSSLGKAPPDTPPPQDTSGLLHSPPATLSSPSPRFSHQPSLWAI